MLKRRPDLVDELKKPLFWDRKGEVPPGKDPYFQLPIFTVVDGRFAVCSLPPRFVCYRSTVNRFQCATRHITNAHI